MKIDQDQSDLIKKVNAYQKEYLNDFRQSNENGRQLFNDLKSQVESNLNKWNATKIIENETGDGQFFKQHSLTCQVKIFYTFIC